MPTTSIPTASTLEPSRRPHSATNMPIPVPSHPPSLSPSPATDRVILRYCSIYGWDDQNSKNYCDDDDSVITYAQTTRVKSNDGLIIMIGIILIGLLLLMCVGLCLFQRMEAEEDRMRDKLAEMESSSESESNSEGEGEESTSYQEHIAREGEQIATKLEILATRRKSITSGDTSTFKGVITENNKITAAATKVRYQLEQLNYMTAKEQEEGNKKRRVGEDEKRVPIAPVISKPNNSPAPMLVQFPVSIEAHQDTVELLGTTSQPKKELPVKEDSPKSPEGKSAPGESKKGRIAAELATLALLKETGNLTNEEFLYSKNLILYE